MEGVGEEVVGQNSELPVQRTLIYKISFSYGVRSKPCYLHKITLMESTLRTATFPYHRNELNLKDRFVTARIRVRHSPLRLGDPNWKGETSVHDLMCTRLMLQQQGKVGARAGFQRASELSRTDTQQHSTECHD